MVQRFIIGPYHNIGILRGGLSAYSRENRKTQIRLIQRKEDS